MTTQTTSLRLILPVQGEFSGTWGDQVNAGITNLVDSAVAGMSTVSVTTANQALTANNYTADQARAAILKLTTTTTAAFAVYIPPATKAYTVYNASAYSATIYCSTVLGNTTAAGTGVAIPAGATTQVNSDGTNVLSSVTYLPSINATPIGATTPSTGAFTTLSATGSISTTNVGVSFDANAAVTSQMTGRYQNNGGRLYLGVESSVGGVIVTGNAAYSAGIAGQNGIGFSGNNGTNLHAFLDTSGNLGLGVTPSAWYASSKAIQIGAFSSFYANLAGYPAVGFNVYENSAGVPTYQVSGNGAGRYSQGSGGAHIWYTAPSGTAGNPITFTQAMTLGTGGILNVGITGANAHSFQQIAGASWSLIVSAVAGAGIKNGLLVDTNTGSTTGSFFAAFSIAGTLVGSITQVGTTAVAYNTTSDHRLKTNVRPANAARFMDIQFRDFEWVDGRHDCGVIAHELQAVYPDLVLGEKDATEVRQVEITAAVPAVTEQVQVSPAIDAVEAVLGDEGAVLQEAIHAVPAVYDTVEVSPAIAAVTEDQTFPVYQQVNYTGLIGRMGTRVQQLQRTVDSQAALIESLVTRLTALEQK